MKTNTQQVHSTGPEDASPNSDEADKQLLEALQAYASGDAFAELAGRYSNSLHAYLSRFLHDRDAAEDVLQETLLQLYLHVKSFDANRPLRPWLYTIARNQAIDYLRGNNRHRVLSLDSTPGLRNELDNHLLKRGNVVDEPHKPDDLVEAMETREWVRQEVGRLSPAQQDVVKLTYFAGHSVSEAASKLGLPRGTVKSRNYASRVRLAKAWKKYQRQTDGPPTNNPEPGTFHTSEMPTAA